jgi:transposase
MAKTREYSKEFKLEAIRLAKESGSVGRAAKDLGIAPQSLYAWISQENEDKEQAFPGKGRLKPDDEELRKLRLENRQLKEINEILKKATKYFARESK